jgi:fibronectin type 3 domain-containing protein
MPTIDELPVVTSVNPADEIPISQSGTACSVSVGTLLASTQPAIVAPTGCLLGRISPGAGGPEPVTLGTGLVLAASTMQANGTDHASFPLQSGLQVTDQAVLNSNGTPMLIELSVLRGLFSAGTNVAIDGSGVISATGGNGTSVVSEGVGDIAALEQVDTLAPTDLIAISQGGTDCAITYANLLDGETIDEFGSAAPVSDSDTFPVGQGTSTMLAQTFAAVWTWVTGHIPSYRQPVLEIAVNTTLDSSAHNGRLLVCSGGVILTPSGTEGSGFSCTVINASSANVTFGSGVVTTSGVNSLSPGQIANIYCVTYSAGTITYGWVSSPLATPVPGQVTGVTAATITYSTIGLSWSSSSSGGAATSYTVQYRITGTSTWTSQAALNTGTTIAGLAAATSYDIQIIAGNASGNGSPSALLITMTAAAPTITPGQVVGLAAVNASATTMGLSWMAPSSGGPVGSFTVLYRVTGLSSWITFATGVTGTTETVTSLSPSTGYDFSVYAVNSAGSGLQSAIASNATLVAVPGTPGVLTAGTVAQTSVPVSWNAPSSGGAVVTYVVQYRLTNSGAWTQQAGITTTSYTITGLLPGTQYDVEVAAVNAGGTSAFTATTNATTLIASPGAPTGLAIGSSTAPTSTTAVQALSWTAGSGGTPTSYNLRYSAHGANAWTTVSGITGTSTTVTGLNANTSYDYEVEAVNAGGTSAWSIVATASTPVVSNYLLSPGIPANPLPSAGWATPETLAPSNGPGVNAVDNSSNGYTAPSAVSFGWSSSNQTPPTNGVTTASNFEPSWWAAYPPTPSVAGSYYLWGIAYNASGQIVATCVSPVAFTVT